MKIGIGIVGGDYKMRKSAVSYIIEGLNRSSEVTEDYSELFESLESERSLVFDNLETTNEEMISEAKTVTFGNNTYPKQGWAVIMAGQPGSGKGYVIKNKVAINAKIIDVDELKRFYVKAAKRNTERGSGAIKDTSSYDFKNPKDVGRLHDIVDKKGYKEEMEDNFFAAYENGNRPNIIYDITGSKADKLKNLGKMLKDLGYKVSLVWVVTNREVALMRNMCRARVVPQNIFHDVANQVNRNVFPFLQSNDAKYYDEAWVVFNSNTSLKELSKEEQREFDKMGVVKFQKSGSGFVIPDDIAQRVYDTLGPEEEDVNNPKNYKSYAEIEADDSIFDKAKAGKASLRR